MRMMCKLIKCALLGTAMVLFTGCGELNKQSDGQGITQEYLPIPSIDAEFSESTKTTYGFLQRDGYWYYNYNIGAESGYIAAPIWEEERVDIYDVKDVMASNFCFGDPDNVIYNINKPQGTEMPSNMDGITAGEWTQPLWAPKEKFEFMTNYSFKICSPHTMKVDGVEQVYQYKIDVLCITAAMYEGCFEEIPVVDMLFYGVKNDVEKKELLAKQRIDKSGKWYIDINDIQKGVQYDEVIMEVNLDGIPEDYAYLIKGFQYNYSENGKALYDSWKAENVGMYIK